MRPGRFRGPAIRSFSNSKRLALNGTVRSNTRASDFIFIVKLSMNSSFAVPRILAPAHGGNSPTLPWRPTVPAVILVPVAKA